MRRSVTARATRTALAAILAMAVTACSPDSADSDSMGSAKHASGGTLANIVKSGVMRIGLTGEQPPLNMTMKSGKLDGLEIDLARALATALKVEAKFVKRPFSELLGALEAGEVDMVISGVTMTPQRNTRVAFAGPYFASGKAILTRSDRLAAAEDVSEINDETLKLAALAGSTSFELLENAAPNAKHIAAKSYDEAVKAVIAGEVDALVADFPICVLSVYRHEGAGLQTIVSPFTFDPIGIALPADDPLFLNLVENYLTTLEGTGLLSLLQAKWFTDGSWIADLP